MELARKQRVTSGIPFMSRHQAAHDDQNAPLNARGTSQKTLSRRLDPHHCLFTSVRLGLQYEFSDCVESNEETRNPLSGL